MKTKISGQMFEPSRPSGTPPSEGNVYNSLPVSGSLLCDITDTGTLAEELKATALANPTVRVLCGIIRSGVTDTPEGFSAPCFYLFCHLEEPPAMGAGTCLLVSSSRRIWSGYMENICAALPLFEWTEITMPSGEHLLLQAPKTAGEASTTLPLNSFLQMPLMRGLRL